MERKKFIDKIESSEGREKAIAILDYSKYLCKSDPRESVLQARKAYSIAKEMQDDRIILGAYVHLAYANFYGGNYVKADQWANHLLESSRKLEIKSAMGLAYNLKGSITHKQNNYALAIENFLKAIDIYLELNDKAELMSCYNNLGSVHLQMSEVKEAEIYFKLALQNALEINNSSQNSIRMNLANVLYNQKKYEEALEIYQKSAIYFKERDITVDEASALYNVATVYSVLDQKEKARDVYKQAYEMFIELNEVFRITETGAALGTTLIELEEYDTAKIYLDESFEIAERENLPQNLANVLLAYANLYSNTGELQKSNDCLLKHIELMKTHYKNLHNEKIDELEAEHKTQIYMLKNQELDEKNRIMQSQINDLSGSLEELHLIHTKLKQEFSDAVERINNQDNLLSSQSRMAVMGEMLSSIAHQWKQPLNVIGVLSQSIEDAWNFDELDDSFLAKQTSMILSQINYMSDTINDFRDFFKTDYLSSFSVKTAIEKSINLVDYMLKRQNAQISIIGDSECSLSGNPNEITQVIVNLINNALEAMQRHGVDNQRIIIKSNCDEEYIKIRIHNNGKVIKDEILDKIFEPYFTTRGRAGTGLGLHICRFIIENKYHGKMNVTNKDDGVEFILKIPIAIQQDDGN
ncbi:MAG: tetratricopeptide repeat-containing sensor histidine kinase [Candidatus Cloacimonetes bacterium]|nr:tetratricopeptide repeat-containing sensor histidine kinase [Candidatus Cloacimonadota bacterium]